MKNLVIGIIALMVLPLTGSAFVKTEKIGDDMPMLNQKAPEFTLKDNKGQHVSLHSLKGKVVVIDFWATWCVPCHQSFPAMQQAVNHYTENKDVVFLFIDTREKEVQYEQLAKADMERNKYRFHVLFDEKGMDGGQNKYYNLYGMAGIPTKFIIDAKGIIRYKLEGYDPRLTDSQSAAEIIKLVEKAKTLY